VSEEGWVYFIQGGDRVKVGWSRDVPRRLAQLQTASSEALKLLGTLPGTRERERAIHRMLAAIHVRGEWFHAEPGLLAMVPMLCECATGVERERIGAARQSRKALVGALGACLEEIDRVPHHGQAFFRGVRDSVSDLLDLAANFCTYADRGRDDIDEFSSLSDVRRFRADQAAAREAAVRMSIRIGVSVAAETGAA
jgi:hypothetical protein